MLGLSRRVTTGHLQQIFSLYGKSLMHVQKHPNDFSKALVAYGDKDDALFAYDHLSVRPGDDSRTEIDGQTIDLRLLDQQRQS